MAETRGIGPLYWHTMNVPARGPVATRDTTHEIDEPYRVGQALILRVPGTGACLVIGRWVGTVDEDAALIGAARIREVSPEEWDVSQARK